MRSTRQLLVLLVVLAAGAVTAPVTAAPERVVRGSVLAPDSAGLARCAWLSRGEESQGSLGYMIKIGARDGDRFKRFTFQAPDRPAIQQGELITGPSFAITFYGSKLGTCTEPPRALGSVGGHGAVFRGEIPWRTRYALVTMTMGPVLTSPGCYALPPLCIVPVESVRLPAKTGEHSFIFTIHP